MSARHTPSPWHVGNSVNGNMCIWGDLKHRQDGYFECCVCAVSPVSKITKIDDANARLIAAAPELLEALEAQESAEKWILDNDQNEPFYDETVRLKLDYAADLRRAAITKAKGETK